MKTEAAETSKAVKTELKKEFPNVKFTVRSQTYSGGDNVSISWTDGPRTEDVSNIVKKYQYGSFNGMEDIYENDNIIKDLPQVKYVQTSRTCSDETRKSIIASLSSYICGFSEEAWIENFMCWGSTLIYREFSKMSL